MTASSWTGQSQCILISDGGADIVCVYVGGGGGGWGRGQSPSFDVTFHLTSYNYVISVFRLVADFLWACQFAPSFLGKCPFTFI